MEHNKIRASWFQMTGQQKEKKVPVSFKFYTCTRLFILSVKQDKHRVTRYVITVETSVFCIYTKANYPDDGKDCTDLQGSKSFVSNH